MNELKKERKKREINKFPKLWKEIFRVFMLDKREGLKEPEIVKKVRDKKIKRKLTIPEKNQIERYNYLKDKKNNFYKKLTAEEILLLAGVKYSDRTQTHIRDHLEKLAKTGLILKEIAKDRKNKFLWGINYEFNEGIKFLYDVPDALEGMKENKEAFELSMENFKDKTRILKSHAKTIITSNKDVKNVEIVEEVYDNWENKEHMNDLIKKFH
jgi:hypothetical protein